MPKSYLVTAVEFSGDQRPVRSGVYIIRLHGLKAYCWSFFNLRTKAWWCCTYFTARGHGDAHRVGLPSVNQRMPWYALPQQIPAGARVERVSGLTFRVTEA